MRKLAAAALLAALATQGCARRPRPRVELTDESSAELSHLIQAGDPAAAVQLLKGFYDIEQGTWRWTAGHFSVALRPPPESLEKGAALVFRFTIPDIVLQRSPRIQVSAKVGEKALEPETFTSSGEHFYKKFVPASAMRGEAVAVEFTLDPFCAAGTLDPRELGVVASSFGFETK